MQPFLEILRNCMSEPSSVELARPGVEQIQMGEALGQLLLCWGVRVPPTPILQKSLLRVNHMFI